MSHEDTDRLIRDPRVDFVAFYRLRGGRSRGATRRLRAFRRYRARARRLRCGVRAPRRRRRSRGREPGRWRVLQLGTELLRHTACVRARAFHDDFVEGWTGLTREYVLGNPLRAGNDARPGGAPAAADTILKQIDLDRRRRTTGVQRRGLRRGTERAQYLAPQLLLDVDHSMSVMREEIFGPVAGIMKVASDEAAVTLMNDKFGLTAAIWTGDEEAARDRRPGPGWNLVHESVRLSRSGAGLGRRQGLGTRLHALGDRLRAPDAAEIVPSTHQDLTWQGNCAATGIT